MNVFETCAVAIVVSFTAVIVATSVALVLGIVSVILGRDHDC